MSLMRLAAIIRSTGPSLAGGGAGSASSAVRAYAPAHLVRIEPEVARVRAEGRPHVDVAREDVEVLPLERIQLIDPEPGVARRLVERDALAPHEPAAGPSRPLPGDQSLSRP